MTKKMESLCLSSYVKLYQIDENTACLFNQAKFKPIRIHGSIDEAKVLFARLRKNVLSEFDKKAIDLFREHFILLPKKSKEIIPENIKNSDWRKEETETFTIRIETRINDHKAILRSIDIIKDRFEKEDEKKYSYLNVKFICNSLLRTSLYDLLLPLMRYIKDKFPFDKDNITFYTDIPFSYAIKYAEKLRLFIVPNLRFNVYIDNKIKKQEIDLLSDMVTRWGFLFNFVFRLSKMNISSIPDSLRMLKSQWGDEFSYSLLVPLRLPAESINAYNLNLPQPSQLENLLDYVLSDNAPNIKQNTLYRLLKNRLATYPNCYSCRTCMGQSLYVDGKGKIGKCFWEGIRSPLSLETGSHESLDKIITPPKKNSVAHHSICKSCPVRYFCGGECVLLSNNSSASKCDENAFNLRCQMRKTFINNFLIDLTLPNNNPTKKRGIYRWKSQDGKLELIEDNMIRQEE